MIIILLEILLMFSITKNLNKKYNFSIYKSIIIFLAFQLVALMIYRLELNALDLEVYYSDSAVYWDTTKKLLEGYKYTTWNMGYVYYCYFIQKLSLFISPIFINISNLLLINLSILNICLLMNKENINKKNIKLFYFITMINPLVWYSLFRNLKDGLFLYLTTIIVFLVYKIFNENEGKHKKILYLLILVIFTLYITTVRAWGFLITILLLGFSIFNKFKTKFKLTPKNIIMLILSIGTFIVALYILLFKLNYMYKLEMWMPIVLENGQARGIINILLGMVKIIIGPGPIRSIFGKEYFMFYTITGNVMSFIGAILWWLSLGILVSKTLLKNNNKNTIANLFGLVVLTFLVIYAMQYGGSLELRFRGVIYILFSSFFCSKFNYDFKKNHVIFFAIALTIITIGGIIYGK